MLNTIKHALNQIKKHFYTWKMKRLQKRIYAGIVISELEEQHRIEVLEDIKKSAYKSGIRAASSAIMRLNLKDGRVSAQIDNALKEIQE